MNKTTNKPRPQHRDLVEEARQLRIAAEELEKKVQLARGTREIKRLDREEMSTPDLLQLVKVLIAEKPRTFRELLDLTGARDNRIKGVIMRIQQEGATLVNIGEPTKALWFLPSPEVLKRLRARK